MSLKHLPSVSKVSDMIEFFLDEDPNGKVSYTFLRVSEECACLGNPRPPLKCCFALF